jgi:F-type H+-transporting ATPase subunit delta
MNQSKIGVRYAKALFELAKEKKVLAETRKDMDFIKAVSEEVEGFRFLVESPVIDTKKKLEIFAAMFKGNISKLSQSFLDLVIKNKRETYIADITRNFVDFVRKDQGVKSASFATAVEIDNKLLEEVKQITESYFKTRIELTSDVNPDLIGGFILRVDDKQFDSSVSSKLNKIKAQLVSTDFEIKY